MDGWLQDFRFSLRLIRRQWVTSLVIMVVLGLGIAANATIFLNFYAVELRPLPFESPEELMVLNTVEPKAGVLRGALSLQDLDDIESLGGDFAHLGRYTYEVFDVAPAAGTDTRAERIEASRISPELFPLLGVEPLLGRPFTAEEGQPGGPPVAILGYDLWQRSYQGDSAVVGQTVRVGGELHEIVGVMPEHFAFPVWHEIWTPLAVDSASSPRGHRAFGAVARFDDPASLPAAQAELDRLGLDLEAQYPESNDGYGFAVGAVRTMWMPAEAKIFQLAQLGAVMFVLLIVCANAANLALAQSTARQRETAVRASLGATRPRLLRQHFTESAVLAAGGGLLGVVGVFWGMEWMLSRVPVSLPFWIRFEFEPVILAYTFFLCCVVVLFFGTAPALRAVRRDLFGAFKGGGRGGAGVESNRLRRFLVAGELALSGVLLVGALLLVKSFVMLQLQDKGYETDRLASVRVSLGQEAGESEADSLARRSTYVGDALDRLAVLPGVGAVGATSHLPSSGNAFDTRFVRREVEAEGTTYDAQSERPATNVHSVAGDYLASLDVGWVRGRDFLPSETSMRIAPDSADVVLISQGLEEILWPGESALGQRLRWLTLEGPGPWMEVVGVVEDVAAPYQLVDSGGRIPNTQLYRPLRPALPSAVTFTLAMADGAAADTVLREARESLQRLDATLPIFEVMTVDRQLALVEWLPRWMGEIFSAFALFALVIAAVGAYGVNAFAVAQRRREMGIRLALGARPTQLVRQMMGGGLKVGLIGLALGMMMALPMAKVLSLLLFEVEATDPQVFGLVVTVLLLVVGVSSWGPARHAATVDPVRSLREE